MIPKSAFLFIFISVSTVLVQANPYSMYDTRVALRGRRSELYNRLEQRANSQSLINWAGATISKSAGSVNSVSATFTVPNPPLDRDGGAAIWIGIDGNTCQSALVQTGVTVNVTGGQVQYQAWRAAIPSIYKTFGLSISARDVISLSLATYNKTSALITVENISSGEFADDKLSGYRDLCEQEAEWIVEDYLNELHTSLVPFLNFTTVTFQYPVAAGPTTVYSISNASLIDMTQGVATLASSQIDGSSVIVSYV